MEGQRGPGGQCGDASARPIHDLDHTAATLRENLRATWRREHFTHQIAGIQRATE